MTMFAIIAIVSNVAAALLVLRIARRCVLRERIRNAVRAG
jgi:hypothetical protein